MSVCFIAGAVTKALQVTAFTLVWTHSVEKTAWQEDWRVSQGGLTLFEARIKGSGAGVDPPPDARLVDGWWRWNPAPVDRGEVILGHSGAVGTGGSARPGHARRCIRPSGWTQRQVPSPCGVARSNKFDAPCRFRRPPSDWLMG
jgi:hypothetical protein